MIPENFLISKETEDRSSAMLVCQGMSFEIKKSNVKQNIELDQ